MRRDGLGFIVTSDRRLLQPMCRDKKRGFSWRRTRAMRGEARSWEASRAAVYFSGGTQTKPVVTPSTYVTWSVQVAGISAGRHWPQTYSVSGVHRFAQ